MKDKTKSEIKVGLMLGNILWVIMMTVMIIFNSDRIYELEDAIEQKHPEISLEQSIYNASRIQSLEMFLNEYIRNTEELKSLQWKADTIWWSAGDTSSRKSSIVDSIGRKIQSGSIGKWDYTINKHGWYSYSSPWGGKTLFTDSLHTEAELDDILIERSEKDILLSIEKLLKEKK